MPIADAAGAVVVGHPVVELGLREARSANTAVGEELHPQGAVEPLDLPGRRG